MATDTVFYNSQDIMAEYDTFYAEDYRAFGQLYPAMAEDLRNYLGDQWTLEETKSMKEEGRHWYTFNHIKPKIDWINGYQIQNRSSSVVVPLNGSSQKTSDQRTKALLYTLQQNDGYRQISDTFSGGNKTGWSLLNAYMDYTQDPVDGDICFARDPYSGFITTPYWTKLDWSDCDHVIKRRYVPPQVAATLLPGQEDEVMQLARDGWERDNKFTWMVFQRVPTGQRMMAYNEFWRLKYEPQQVIVNKMTKKWVDFDGDRDALRHIKQVSGDLGHEIEIITRKKRFVEKHIILNNNYMRTEINPYGLDEYPFAVYIPIFEPESEEYTFKVQSLVRLLKDPQREYNRRRSQVIDIVESQLNSGYIEEEDAVINPKMLYQSGQGKRIVRRKGTTPDAVTKIPPAMVPPSFFQETQEAKSDMMEVVGMNPTTFGHVETKQVSALVEMQRQAASLTGQQYLFDNLRDMQKNISRKIVKMQQGWSANKLRKILGEEPEPDFFDKDATKYDITITEGILTDTQKYMFFRQILDLKQLGEPVPPGELTKLAPIQGKAEFMEDCQAYQKQIEQTQQMITQTEQMQSQSLAASLQAKAVADHALSKERETRAMANLGLETERIAKADQDHSKAMLDNIKAIQELEKGGIDIATLKDQRLVNIIQFFQNYDQYMRSVDQQQKIDNQQQTQGSANAQTQTAQTGT